MNKYSDLQVIELIDGYQQFDADDHDSREQFIAKYMSKHVKSKKSVIGKLSKMGIYITRPKISKVTKSSPETKKQMLQRLANILGMDVAKLEGIDISPKLSLLNLIERVKDLQR